MSTPYANVLLQLETPTEYSLVHLSPFQEIISLNSVRVFILNSQENDCLKGWLRTHGYFGCVFMKFACLVGVSHYSGSLAYGVELWENLYCIAC